MKIETLTTTSPGLTDAIQYFWQCWGNDSNFAFYKDCIDHSLREEQPLPKFYVMIEEGAIIASYALVTNDLISRQDLMPWLACLYVNETHRKRAIAEQLLKHGLAEARRKGFDHLYLSTDLEGFYEKKGWAFYATGYGIGGDPSKIYCHPTG